MGLHLNGTAACAFTTDEGSHRGKAFHGPCCSISPFLFRTASGWVRTEPPTVSGSKVVVAAKVSGGLSAVSDIAYAFENQPPCALYNGASASGPDSHDGLVATPFRRAVQDRCPLNTTLCPAGTVHRAGVVGDQCCGAVGGLGATAPWSAAPPAGAKEKCVPGMGCYSKDTRLPSYGGPDGHPHRQLPAASASGRAARAPPNPCTIRIQCRLPQPSARQLPHVLAQRGGVRQREAVCQPRALAITPQYTIRGWLPAVRRSEVLGITVRSSTRHAQSASIARGEEQGGGREQGGS